MRLLIVEDESKIAQFLRRGLNEEGFAVDTAHDGDEALELFGTNVYDTAVLDLLLPKVNGIEVCRQMRSKNVDIPILILTAKAQIEDKIAGFNAGADDYLTKPFSFEELVARIHALIRRGKSADPAVLSFDTLTLDPKTKTATRNGKNIILTTKEFALLEYFMRHPNTVISQSTFIEHVWDYNYEGFSNIVETYVKYLRKKLRTTLNERQLIHTMRGSGYILKIE